MSIALLLLMPTDRLRGNYQMLSGEMRREICMNQILCKYEFVYLSL